MAQARRHGDPRRDSLTEEHLKKAGFATTDPIAELKLDEYNVVIPDITTMTREALKETGLDNRAIVKCKNMFALGANEEAARVSGVNVFATTIAVFALAGAMYGWAGFVESARIAPIPPTPASTTSWTPSRPALWAAFLSPAVSARFPAWLSVCSSSPH